MRTTTLLRTSSAVRAAPFLVAGALYFYFGGIASALQALDLRWPASSITTALYSVLPPIYALTAAVACFEGHRLRRLGTWQIGPTRSELSMAFRSLLTVFGVFAALVVALALTAVIVTDSGVDGYAAGALALPLVVLAGHTLLGYCVGRRVNALYAAPALAVGVQLVVGASVSYQTYWPRHISGRIAEVQFGEAYRPAVYLVTALPTVSVAVALALLLLTRLRRVTAAALALAVAAIGLLVPYRIVSDWNWRAPTAAGLAEVTCTGTAPTVCLPAAADVNAARLHTDTAAVLGKLADAGALPRVPERVSESKGEAAADSASSAADWHISLLSAASSDRRALAFSLTQQSVNWYCSQPDWEIVHYSTMWAMTKVGAGKLYLDWLRTEPEFRTTQEPELTAEVERVLTLSVSRQKAWFDDTVARACADSTISFRPR
ncbi:hypothetical protein ABZ896_01490 [Streptomyces sp. NPDC047072]|uniref:hypothetical protein n=1 Tax=Streptomyces sp. NPDC047072 TaxID=3154809 RepID=UPI0033DDE745